MDAVLLKIKRQFRKEEAVKHLQAELSASQFKNGELISENEELRHEKARLEKEIAKLKKELSNPIIKLTKDDLKEKKFIELKKCIETMRKSNEKLRADVDLWRDKCLSLSRQLEKYQN